MVKVNYNGRVVPNMKDNGKTMPLKAKESIIILMEIFMKESFIRVKLMDLASILRKMALYMKASG